MEDVLEPKDAKADPLTSGFIMAKVESQWSGSKLAPKLVKQDKEDLVEGLLVGLLEHPLVAATAQSSGAQPDLKEVVELCRERLA